MTSTAKHKTEKKNSRLESYFQKSSPKTGNPNKRPNSSLSPIDDLQTTKKLNMEKLKKDGDSANRLKDLEKTNCNSPTMEDSSLKQIIGPLVDEVKLLRESFHENLAKMDSKLETAIITQQKDLVDLKDMIVTEKQEFTDSLVTKVETNTTSINQLLEENRRLHQENSDLRERLSRIEMTQLNNNIIANGMPEQPWEPHEVTKERITEVIVSSMGLEDDPRTKEKAKEVEITCVSRLGTYILCHRDGGGSQGGTRHSMPPTRRRGSFNLDDQ